jgi:hypothetical protein
MAAILVCILTHGGRHVKFKQGNPNEREERVFVSLLCLREISSGKIRGLVQLKEIRVSTKYPH